MEKDFLKHYKKVGYFLFKGFYEKDYITSLKNSIAKLDPKVYIPYSETPWGYGNLKNKVPFSNILFDKKFNAICSEILDADYTYNHVMIVNKAAWIGPDVEWHQEAFNMQTYAPGCNPMTDWKKFMQIFIAIDDHKLQNGCLKVIPKSHNEGILPYEDLVNINYSHKRRVQETAMDKLYKKYGFADLEMEKGDLLIFNHLLVHGSSTNISPDSRLSLLIQAQEMGLKKDEKIFSDETKFRKKFIIDCLQKKIDQIKSGNMYKDFNEENKLK